MADRARGDPEADAHTFGVSVIRRLMGMRADLEAAGVRHLAENLWNSRLAHDPELHQGASRQVRELLRQRPDLPADVRELLSDLLAWTRDEKRFRRLTPPDLLTPNQLVAYNLWRARRERRWTHEQAAEQLEPHLGVRWTKAVFSAAERSVEGTRKRNFSADEIVAFARGFRLPVAYFFMPPEFHLYGEHARVATNPAAAEDPKHPAAALRPHEMLDLALATRLDDNDGERLVQRLRDIIATLPDNWPTRAAHLLAVAKKQQLQDDIRYAALHLSELAAQCEGGFVPSPEDASHEQGDPHHDH